MKVKVPRKIISFLKKEKKFFIATHINPEGDALGSALALSMALTSIGKETMLYDKDTVPEFYRFLPGHEKFITSIPSSIGHDWSLIILDCNTKARAGIKGLNYKYAVVIDHHETESNFGDIRWIEPEAAATGMMVFYIIKKLGIPITREIAINLYSAISIDTGTFRYGNTTAEVLKVSAELIEAGANAADVSNNLYETWSRERFALLIMVLNTLEIRNGIAMTVVTREMFRKSGTGPEDTETFSSFPRKMKNITLSALFREVSDNYWKVSLRSRGNVNVARIATYFNGGGHKNAAGYRTKARLETAKKALIHAIKNMQKKA